MRDDFSEDVKRKLALRVGHCCSNPDCRATTTGPQDDPSRTVNIGVAAHITAAAAGGPRYNSDFTPDQRCSIDNGIWLCQNCAHLIDTDLGHYTGGLLRAWKTVAEDRARNSLGKTASETDRASLPNLELYLEGQGIEGGYSGEPVRWFVLGLKNSGGGAAKFPMIRFRRLPVVSVDRYGIDGNGGFGLRQQPSDNEWVVFQGGADDIIHPGTTVKITRLQQSGENRGLEGVDMTPRAGLWGANGPQIDRWVFNALAFEFQISAEGISTVSGTEMIPAASKEWRKRM